MVAQSYGLDTKFWEYRLQCNWRHIVGPTVAAHTQPHRIAFRKLQLLVENSLWMQQLVFLKPRMLEKNQCRDRQILNFRYYLSDWRHF